ncbi:MAG: cyclohexa-1,5-dienecarbonyl-CoA hydratase [Acidobacteriota bacterium]
MVEPSAKNPAVEVEPIEEGAYWRVVLGGSKGNIIDTTMIGALTGVFREAKKARDLKAVCLEGRGRHFSFGASVPEHQPGKVEKMLPSFHGLFPVMLESSVAVLAAVRGQCLGGALELASFCHRVFASPDAKLGQPEIVLGVFAPVASMFLAERVGRGKAEDVCLSGRVLDAEEALRIGLVDAVAEDPSEAALAYAREFLLPRSASSLRFAVKAARHGLRARLDTELKALERLYLDELMSTGDAVEGIRAFLEKRRPQWRNQ